MILDANTLRCTSGSLKAVKFLWLKMGCNGIVLAQNEFQLTFEELLL